MRSARPADAGYTSARLNSNLLRVLCGMLQAEGIAPARLFAGTGLAPADLSRAGLRVSFRQAQAVVRRAVRMLRRRVAPGFGLRFADHLTVSSYGPLGMAMLSSASVEEALRVGIRYRRASGVMLDLALEVQEPQFVLSYGDPYPDPDCGPFLQESAVACAVDFFRAFSGRGFAPQRVEFAFAEPPWAALYRERFRCPLAFDAPRTRLVAERSWLALPLETHDPLTELQVLAALRADDGAPAQDHDVAESIRALLRRNPAHPLRMPEVAARLDMNDRTLRRHLARLGLSFRALCDGLRKELALELLHEPGMTAEAVAHRVGYAGARNFRRAVKRWTGRTAAELKKN